VHSSANDYLTKPLDFPIALARVQSHLARKETRQALERSIRELVQTNRQLESELAELKRINAHSDTPTAP
jgi:DNA-binding response OmpR family regulator